MMHAAHTGDVAALKSLLANPARSRDKKEASMALVEACSQGHLAAVQVLLPHANPAADQHWALLRATQHGHAACVQALLDAYDATPAIESALLMSVRHARLDCMRRLLSWAKPGTWDGFEALCTAAGRPQRSPSWWEPVAPEMSRTERQARLDATDTMVDLLLPHVDITRGGGRPLWEAASAGRLNLVDKFLPLSPAHANGSVALRMAAKGEHWDVFDRLLPLSDPTKAMQDALSMGAWKAAGSLSVHASPGSWALPMEIAQDQKDKFEQAALREGMRLNSAHARPNVPKPRV
jgi:hypothetical protein